MNALAHRHLRRISVAATVALGAAVLANAMVFAGLSVKSTNGSNIAGLDLVAPPTNVATTHDSNHTTNPQEIDLTWTASTTTYVTGYAIQRALDGVTACGPFSTVGSVSGRTTTSFNDNATNDSASPPQLNVQYCYQVLSVYSNWSATSTPSNVALSMPPTSVSDTTNGSATAYNAVFRQSAAGLAWAVGDGGAIATTSNGNAWTAVTSGTTQDLMGVSFVSASAGWAVGRSGTIVATTNGTSWSAQASGIATDLYAVSAADSTHVWAVGAGGVIRFYNGSTWAAQTSGVSTDLRGVWAQDGTDVWAVGAGGVIRFFNGTTWGPQTSGTANDLLGVVAINASKVWAVGRSGTIRVTSNGGTSWASQTSGTAQDLNAVGTSSNDLWAVGASATTLQNGGQSAVTAFSWTTGTVPPGFSADLRGTSGQDGCKFYAVGASTTILSSDNGCPTWAGTFAGGSYTLGAADLTNLGTLNGTAYQTQDGWPTSFPTGCTGKYVQLQFTPDFLDSAAVSTVVVSLTYKAVTSGGTMAARLLVSGDGGATYTTFGLTAPTTSFQTALATVSGVINTRTTLSGMVGCFQAIGTSSYSIQLDQVHVDVN